MGSFAGNVVAPYTPSGTWNTPLPVASVGPPQPPASTKALATSLLVDALAGENPTPPFPPWCVQQSSQESEKLPSKQQQLKKQTLFE